MNAFELACGIPWAITEEALSGLLAVAARLEGLSAADASPEAIAAAIDAKHAARHEALSAVDGEPLEGSRNATVKDGVATIPIDGPIFRKANLLTRYSGATSMDVLARDFKLAMAEPAVRGVVLAIDSPGGEAHGTHELASLVRSHRGQKPVVAHAWGSCASGAYWIASAAGRLVASPMALLGSIGVISTIRNQKDPRDLHFVSSVSPNKRPDLDRDEGRAQVQSVVDDLGRVFVAEVAANRGVRPDRVLRDFGRGGILVGHAARQVGMADRIDTLDRVHADMASGRFDPVPDYSERIFR